MLRQVANGNRVLSWVEVWALARSHVWIALRDRGLGACTRHGRLQRAEMEATRELRQTRQLRQGAAATRRTTCRRSERRRSRTFRARIRQPPGHAPSKALRVRPPLCARLHSYRIMRWWDESSRREDETGFWEAAIRRTRALLRLRVTPIKYRVSWGWLGVSRNA